MFIHPSIQSFFLFIESHFGVSKQDIITHFITQFSPTIDRSILYTEFFAVRFSSTKSGSFSNTVVSLSVLQKYDHIPFFVCQIMPNETRVYLANSTFVHKVSHSSHALAINNIRGSINGGDIMRDFDGLENSPKNFVELFEIHQEIGFEGNLERLVFATQDIELKKSISLFSSEECSLIIAAPQTAVYFCESKHYLQLKTRLDEKVKKYADYILLASLIENVNLQGNVIEYLIAGKDDDLKTQVIQSLQKRETPTFRNSHQLGDYDWSGGGFLTKTDIKTKVMVLSSNPKAYNVDKMLKFLTEPNTVFFFYFVGVDISQITNTALVSIFHQPLMKATRVQKHWAGRNSRGVTQFNGAVIHDCLTDSYFKNEIVVADAQDFLCSLFGQKS